MLSFEISLRNISSQEINRWLKAKLTLMGINLTTSSLALHHLLQCFLQLCYFWHVYI